MISPANHAQRPFPLKDLTTNIFTIQATTKAHHRQQSILCRGREEAVSHDRLVAVSQRHSASFPMLAENRTEAPLNRHRITQKGKRKKKKKDPWWWWWWYGEASEVSNNVITEYIVRQCRQDYNKETSSLASALFVHHHHHHHFLGTPEIHPSQSHPLLQHRIISWMPWKQSTQPQPQPQPHLTLIKCRSTLSFMIS